MSGCNRVGLGAAAPGSAVASARARWGCRGNLPKTSKTRRCKRWLREPAHVADEWTRGYAEYFGNRHRLTQRVVWDGPWKFVFNGFDFDELYQLDEDPYEMKNLAQDPAYDE